MKKLYWLAASLLVLGAGGCFDDDEEVGPRDFTPPAAPRGLFSVTGDHAVVLHWLENTEPDVAGYNVYRSSCPGGPGCQFEPIGTTVGTSFAATNLTNGETYYFAVTAFDRSGNESELSSDDVPDTPRPAGFNAVLRDFTDFPSGPAGWDFSAAQALLWDDPETDIYFGDNGAVAEMFAADTTDIQDAGWRQDLDGVDYSPSLGWSPTGTAELVVGHCYIVWTHDDHFAKFRVTSLTPTQVTFDWAYQVAVGLRELGVRPARTGPPQRGSGAWIR